MQRGVFPNYCFTRGSDSEYKITKRPYLPKELSRLNRTSSKSDKSGLKMRSTMRSNEPQVMIAHSCIGLKSTKTKKVQKAPKVKSRIAGTTPKTTILSQHRAPGRRTVKFCLPHEVEMELAEKRDRENAGGTENQEQVPESEYEPAQQNETSRQLEESFADFFNIVHDNVLEAVQKAVESKVEKFFQQTIDKLEQVASQVARNETLLNKMYRDLTNKMSEQTDSSINQFKFVAQMLIDSQTVHYRALHSQRERFRHSRSQRTSSCSLQSDPRSTAGDGNETATTTHQHKLRNQQQQQAQTSLPLAQHVCQNCVANGHTLVPCGSSKSIKQQRRNQSIGTASMPNLHSQSSNLEISTSSTTNKTLPIPCPTPCRQKRVSKAKQIPRRESVSSRYLNVATGIPPMRGTSPVMRKLRYRYVKSGCSLGLNSPYSSRS